jgi:PAS domain S-box-containing protein
MPRKLLILAGVVVASHAAVTLTVGVSLLGSLLGNSLQTFACAVATACALGALRRARGAIRPFWLLVAIGIAVWGLANLGWTYYEVVLQREPPTGSAVRFLFGIQCIFFAMAVLLDQDNESTTLDTESLLDFIQIAIVFFFIFVGFYYVPAHSLDDHSALVREVSLETSEDALLFIVALIQAMRSRRLEIRRLYLGFAAYLFSYTVCAGTANYAAIRRSSPTGTWFDLCWTLPLLVGAAWAATWQPEATAQKASRRRVKSFGEVLLTNAGLAAAPLIVLLQVAQFGSPWRLLSFSLLGVSIVCYAARLGLSQFRAATTSESLRRHTQAMNSAVDGMAILDRKGVHSYVNAAFAHTMGYADPKEMVGKSWLEVYSQEDRGRVETQIAAVLRTNGKWFGPVTIHRRDGTEFPMELAITALPNGEHVCVSRDIEDRRQADAARLEAEAKYRKLVEQVAAVSYIAQLGIHGEWLYVSPQVENMFGFSAEEWLADSRNWIQHVHPDDHKVIEAAEEASKRGERFQAEYRILCKDGRVIWVSDTAVVVPSDEARPLMEGIIVDITDRKHLETQLQQSRRMEAIGRLAGGIAHDFNNLLTIIKGYTELALKRLHVAPELRTDIERVEDASERATSLVRQLLAFSRRQVLQPKLLDLNGIVLGLDKLLRRLMDEDIEMVTIPGKDLGTIQADPAQIEQVIMNLVVNARDAMPKGGRLTVETQNVNLDTACTSEQVTMPAGKYVLLAVSDSGVGMTPEAAAHIFEPFYTTKQGGRGTGLGLSTVYGIVKQSGGYIWVYSEPGKGSTFKVYLPCVDEPAETLPAPQKGDETRTGTETILLVEDEPSVRELTRAALADRGYSVMATDTPEAAERVCEKNESEIHLLLTDVVMPGISGRELAKRLTSRYPKMRVLFMSGYSFNIISHGGTLEDGVAFLQKPFTPSALADKVREVLDHSVHTT